MARFSAVFALADAKPTIQTIAATSAGAEIDPGTGNIILVAATGDVNFCQGVVGSVPAPDATCMILFGGAYWQLDTGANKGGIRFYNPGATPVTVYVQQMAE